ncbi:MAG: NAD-dependent epimerase/dehydratase family protein [Candidatus Hydrothermales bacterium]
MDKLPLIHKSKTLKETMHMINETGLGLAFVVDSKERLKGVVSDGDIRRALLKGVSLTDKIEKIMNKKPIKFYEDWNRDKILVLIQKLREENKIPKSKSLIVPVLSRNKKIKRIVTIEPKGNFFFDSIPKKLKKTKKVLVIGGAGYIGSVLVRMLLKRGYKVKVFDNLLYGDQGIIDINSKKFKFFRGDLINTRDIVEAIQDVDLVVHLAAIVGDPSSKLRPRETLEINYFSTKNLGEIAKYFGIGKLIFASTCSVYGYKEEKCTEETEPSPLSLYAETKLFSEKALLDLKGDGFSPVILRFATAFGYSPRMRFDLVVNLLIAKALKEKKITVYGDGKQIRPFMHVKDIARAIIKVIEAPDFKVGGEIFNVGSDNLNLSILEVAEKIREMVPESKIVLLKEKEDNRNYFVSFEKIRKTLKFKAKYGIEQAVKEISEAFEKGKIKNFYNKIYSNYYSLSEM